MYTIDNMQTFFSGKTKNKQVVIDIFFFLNVKSLRVSFYLNFETIRRFITRPEPKVITQLIINLLQLNMSEKFTEKVNPCYTRYLGLK